MHFRKPTLITLILACLLASIGVRAQELVQPTPHAAQAPAPAAEPKGEPAQPPKRKPVVDVKRCEDRSRCGALIEVPASPLWLVHTYNGRGDYYHENRELWDPATGKYVHLAGGKLVWSKDAPPVPNNETDYRGMRISPLGVLSYQGAVFDSARVYYTPSDPEYGGGSSCGWAGGGWRVDGPTDGFHH